MSFIQTSAPRGQRVDPLLSADNGRPDRYGTIDLLRRAAPDMGIKPPVLTTLEVLLSFLPARRDHDCVFASNATLCFRRGGITPRTLRRHIETLAELGLVQRTDSPNGKRYVRRDPTTGEVLRFGFDLRPVFARADDLAKVAQIAEARAQRMAFLRTKLRHLVHRRLQRDAADPVADEARRVLRRRSSDAVLSELIESLDGLSVDNPTQAPGPTPEMSADDGRNVRHHHTSKKEYIDTKTTDTPRPLTVPQILEFCPAAVEFASDPITTQDAVIRHGRSLSAMIGVSRSAYERAVTRLGHLGAALTVWALMQMRAGIANMGAYFQSVTTGARSAGFDPAALILRLGRGGAGGANCPRTT